MAKLIKSYWKIRTLRYAVIGLVIVMSVAVAYAATVPNTFTAGTTARASEVNDNFTYLADRAWEITPGTPFYRYSNVRVGIGTDSPQTALHISNAASYQAALRIEDYGDTVAASPAVIFSDANGELGGVGDNVAWDANNFHVWSGSTRSIHFFTDGRNTASNTPQMVIDTDGNVGIGNSVPLYPLDMASGAHVTAGGVWTDASSRDLKENIASLTSDDALAALKNLTPVTFNYKADKAESYAGFIAEDVPALVATNDRKGLAPMDIVAVLTKVVQGQQAMMEAQQETIEALNKKVAELQSKIK